MTKHIAEVLKVNKLKDFQFDAENGTQTAAERNLSSLQAN